MQELSNDGYTVTVTIVRSYPDCPFLPRLSVLPRSTMSTAASRTTFRSSTRTRSRCLRSRARATYVPMITHPTSHTSTSLARASSSRRATCTAWHMPSFPPTPRCSVICVSRASTTHSDTCSETVSAVWGLF